VFSEMSIKGKRLLITTTLLLLLLAFFSGTCFAGLFGVTKAERDKVSKQMLAKIAKINGPPKAVSDKEKVAQVFYSLVQYTERKDVKYKLRVVDSKNVNAYAMPNGTVVVFTGLIRALPQDDLNPLAFVCAHELSHIEKKHADAIIQNKVIMALIIGTLVRKSDKWVKLLGGISHQLITSGYVRSKEEEADREGIKLMRKANFDPNGALVTFKILEELEKRRKGINIFPNHPKTSDRYKNVICWMKEDGLTIREPGPEVLVHLKGSTGTTGVQGSSALFEAIESGDRDKVNRILQRNPEAVNEVNRKGDSPLHCAARLGYTEIAKELLSYGANINARGHNQWTPLHWTSERGHPDTARLLISRGANPNSRRDDGFTPLHIAAYWGRKKMVQYFLSHGADKNIRTNRGLTPSRIALIRKHNEVARLIRYSKTGQKSYNQENYDDKNERTSATGEKKFPRIKSVESTPIKLIVTEDDFPDMAPEKIKRGTYLKYWEKKLVWHLRDNLGEQLESDWNLKKRARSVTYGKFKSRYRDDQVLLVFVVDSYCSYILFTDYLDSKIIPKIRNKVRRFSRIGVGVKKNLANKKHIVILIEK